MLDIKKNLITVQELAKIFDLKVSYVYKLIHQKKLSYYKPFGKKVYFKLSEVLSQLYGSKIEANTSKETIKTLADSYLLKRR